MIPKASQRAGGQDLATHLQNAHDNENVEIANLRGAVASDLHGAFKEWQVQAETLTRCEKYLYSLSINPDPEQGPLTRDQYLDYIGRTEEALGLRDQPRAVVFHVKEGREHCHVIWSRIDADKQKAVHIAFDKDKLMRVTRAFAQDHDLKLPAGYDKSRKVGQVSQYEQAQWRQGGLSKDEHKQQITEAWQQSDDPRAFAQALAERGYILASGSKRPYVLVDLYGGTNALSKLIDDRAVRIRDVRAFLGKDFPEDSLPSVEEAQALVAAHRKLIEKSADADQRSAKLAALKHAQRDRRKSVEDEREALKYKHHALRTAMQAKHREERTQLRTDHVVRMREIKHERQANRPTGLAAFLGRITGVSLIQRTLHRRQDARKTAAHLEQRAALKTRQAEEQKVQELRLKVQAREIDRKARALEKVDARELAALTRDQKRDARVRGRPDPQAMPSLVEIAGLEPVARERVDEPDLLSAFAKARDFTGNKAPDLLEAFERAAQARGEGDQGDASGNGLENARPPDVHKPEGPDRGRR